MNMNFHLTDYNVYEAMDNVLSIAFCFCVMMSKAEGKYHCVSLLSAFFFYYSRYARKELRK